MSTKASIERLKVIHHPLLEAYEGRDVQGDGNCGPRAIAVAHCGNEDDHLKYRLLSYGYIESNPEEFKEALSKGILNTINMHSCFNILPLDLPADSLADTEEQLPMEGRYVGDVWLSGAARALQRDIIVFTDRITDSGHCYKIIILQSTMNINE